MFRELNIKIKLLRQYGKKTWRSSIFYPKKEISYCLILYRVVRRRAQTSVTSTDPTVRTRSSESNVFCLQRHCFYCGVKVSDQHRDHKEKKYVETLECKLSVDQAIAKRPADDPWSVEVS